MDTQKLVTLTLAVIAAICLASVTSYPFAFSLPTAAYTDEDRSPLRHLSLNDLEKFRQILAQRVAEEGDDLDDEKHFEPLRKALSSDDGSKRSVSKRYGIAGLDTIDHIMTVLDGSGRGSVNPQSKMYTDLRNLMIKAG